MATFEFTFPRRSAKAKLHTSLAKRLSLTDAKEPGFEEYDCFVLLTAQELDGEAGNPVFVCEFLNGMVANIYTENVRFTDVSQVNNDEI